MMPRSTLLALHVAALVLCTGPGGVAETVEPVSVPAGAPDAILDLNTRAGAERAGGPWRFLNAQVLETDFRSPGPDRKPTGGPNRTYEIRPRAGASDFDDSSWEVLDPTTLEARRSTGKVCFAWYRFRVVVPSAVGGFDPTGSTLVFETVVDDYAEVWVDGELPRQLGQSGGSVVAGFNAPNRLVIARDAQPGQVIQIALFTMNGPISAAPENYIWIRRARLDFFAPHRQALGRETPVSPRVSEALESRETSMSASAGNAFPIEAFDRRFHHLVPQDARVERLIDGFTWLEGPLWDRKHGRLLFSDIPNNSVYAWSESGIELVLRPSGYTGSAPFTGREPGSNGLLFDGQGRLLLCQHGDRRLARLRRDGGLDPVVTQFQGQRLNSPNDAVLAKTGDLYFTDPPFGLPGTYDDPTKELAWSGVYRLHPSGELQLLTRELRAPNGVALSPDGKTLVVSNADASRPIWMAFDMRDDGTWSPGRVFADASAWVEGRRGLPDGMKFDHQGNLFACGPDGIYVFSPDGELLGRIDLGVATANCAWGDDGSSLYITASTAVYRLRLNTRGAGFERERVASQRRDR